MFWDYKKGGVVRVIVTLFEDCLASRTMNDDFINTPADRQAAMDGLEIEP